MEGGGMNQVTIIRSTDTKRTFSRKMSFPLLTIALWALLLYAGIKIVWSYSTTQEGKSRPTQNEPVKKSSNYYAAMFLTA
jgi:hypothetical protein